MGKSQLAREHVRRGRIPMCIETQATQNGMHRRFSAPGKVLERRGPAGATFSTKQQT